jgi:nucleotide-binding universal stress UspA family protein
MRIETILKSVQTYLDAEARLDRCRPPESERDVLRREVAEARIQLRMELEAARTHPEGGAFKRILVAVDESQQAGFAIDVASRLAGELKAQLILVHISPATGPFTPEFAFVEPEMRAQYLRAGEAVLNQAKARVPDMMPVETVLRQGVAADQILDVATTFDADLIVIGTHGRGRFTQVVIGSVAAAVARKATCPVITVAHAPDWAASRESQGTGGVTGGADSDAELAAKQA